jgi:arsenate reductase
MITIYHNPRCRKSREGLAIVEASEKPFKVIPYLNEVPTKNELKNLVKKLGIKPIAMVRTNETLWKEHFKGKDLSEDDILDAMVSFPKLIERPIVISGDKAVIGRPPEKIRDLLAL